jgi:hypothetical protein
MSTANALVTSVLGAVLGCSARTGANDPTAQPPTPDEIVIGHAAELRALLSDVHDARSEIALREPAAARVLVAEAAAIMARIADGRAYALIDEDTGTLQQLSSASDAAFMTAFDQVSEQRLLDLRTARVELDQARSSLATAAPSSASHHLARIEGAVRLRRTITPDHDALVAENVKIALREVAAGDWPGAGVAFEAAHRDAAMPAGVPRVVFRPVLARP